jgi:hypothetical protein
VAEERQIFAAEYQLLQQRWYRELQQSQRQARMGLQ